MWVRAGPSGQDEDALDERPYRDARDDEDADDDDEQDVAHDRPHQLADRLAGVAQVEIVNAERSQEDAEQTGGQLGLLVVVGAGLLVGRLPEDERNRSRLRLDVSICLPLRLPAAG